MNARARFGSTHETAPSETRDAMCTGCPCRAMGQNHTVRASPAAHSGQRSAFSSERVVVVAAYLARLAFPYLQDYPWRNRRAEHERPYQEGSLISSRREKKRAPHGSDRPERAGGRNNRSRNRADRIRVAIRVLWIVFAVALLTPRPARRRRDHLRERATGPGRAVRGTGVEVGRPLPGGRGNRQCASGRTAAGQRRFRDAYLVQD